MASSWFLGRVLKNITRVVASSSSQLQISRKNQGFRELCSTRIFIPNYSCLGNANYCSVACNEEDEEELRAKALLTFNLTPQQMYRLKWKTKLLKKKHKIYHPSLQWRKQCKKVERPFRIYGHVLPRIKYRIEKMKQKETFLIEALRKYENMESICATATPSEPLTEEEAFHLKKIGLKAGNYIPVGRQGIIGGVILCLHQHWQRFETAQVYCKYNTPDEIQEHAEKIAKLSGGIPVHVDDKRIIVYRGKNYAPPEVKKPKTLSWKKAYVRFNLTCSLRNVRCHIAVLEKELELYYRHTRLYGQPTDEMELDASLNTVSEMETDAPVTAANDSHSKSHYMSLKKMKRHLPFSIPKTYHARNHNKFLQRQEM